MRRLLVASHVVPGGPTLGDAGASCQSGGRELCGVAGWEESSRPLHLLPYETPSVRPIFTAKVTLERHVLAGVAALRQRPLPRGCVQHS